MVSKEYGKTATFYMDDCLVKKLFVTGVYPSPKCTLWARGEVMDMNHLLTYETLCNGFYKYLLGCYTASGLIASGQKL
jgi:hypothetical protein